MSAPDIQNKLKSYEQIFARHLHELAENSLKTVAPAPVDFMSERVNEADSLVRARIESEFFGLGPLQPLLADESITEIMLGGHQSICFEKAGRIQMATDNFVSAKTYANFIDRFSVENRLNVNMQKPMANGRWLNWRFHLILPPLSSQPTLTLRRHRERSFEFSELQDLNWASGDAIEICKTWILEKRNLLIVGTTNSGKTSLISAGLNLLPQTERVLVLEDTDELKLPNPVSVKLLTRDKNVEGLLPITLTDLVAESLRMRPDRIVLGEMRGAEAKDFLLALSTGHSGSLATLHASDPHQALIRLEFLVQMGAPMWSTVAIRQLIRSGVFGIVVVENIDGRRRLQGLHRMASLESTGFCLDTVYQA